MALLTKGFANPKIAKGDWSQYETVIQHLAPANLSGHEVCASRSNGCTIGCLNTAGRGKMSPIQQARINRTIYFFKHRDDYKRDLVKELTSFVRRCDKLAKRPAVRLNGTSDIVWESLWPELFQAFPQVQFYDYTKHFKRCLGDWSLPANYHLTFSRSETNDEKCKAVLAAGKVNVAAVFSTKNFPESYFGYPTYSADDDDLRFLDPPGGHIGCLYAKGKAKKDATGFVIQV